MQPERILKKDTVFSKVIETTTPLKLPKSGNVYNELVKAITYQQISYKAADTIYKRFLNLIGNEAFTPKDLLGQKIDDLRGVGFSKRKAEYSHNIAHFFLQHDLFETNWKKYSDQEIIDLLTQIKGVGEWTVQMILIFELHRPDVFPYLDLAIQQSMIKLYDLKTEKKALYKEMSQIAEKWQPFRSIATLYLWGWKRMQS